MNIDELLLDIKKKQVEIQEKEQNITDSPLAGDPTYTGTGYNGKFSVVKTLDTLNICSDGKIKVTINITFNEDNANAVIADYFSFGFLPTNISPSPTDSAPGYILWELGPVLSGNTITVSYELQPNGAYGLLYADYSIDLYSKDGDSYIGEDYLYLYVVAEVRGCVEANCCQTSCETITLEPCVDNPKASITVSSLTCQGRIVDLTIFIDNICVGRRLGLGIFLLDLNSGKKIGFKVIEIPAQTAPIGITCIPLEISGICFVIPGELCANQYIRANVIANYLDYDYNPECN